MLVNPAHLCFCQSGRTAGNCCFPSEPPILQSEPRITGANLHVQLSAPGIGPVPWPRGWKPFVSLNQPSQVDADIEEMAMAFLRAGVSEGMEDPHDLVEALRPLADVVSRFAESIYAARYHQIQFLFRLQKVVSRQTFDFTPPRSNAVVRINDRPLQAELEAFLLRVTSTLDAMAKVLCVVGKWSEKHGSFSALCRYLTSVSRQQLGSPTQLLKAMRDHESWVQEVRRVRNSVAHQGTTENFVPVAHEGILIHDAEVAGVRAGEFVLRVWRSVKALSRDTAFVFRPGDGSPGSP